MSQKVTISFALARDRKYLMYQRLLPQRMLVSHREVLYEAKNNEITKIFAKMPNQSYLVVRDPENTWFLRSEGLNPLKTFLRNMRM